MPARRDAEPAPAGRCGKRTGAYARRVRVHVVSDVHGASAALAGAAGGADALVCLGDLLCFLDYLEPANGLFPELFGEVAARRFIELRTGKRFDEARVFSRDLWRGLDGDGGATLREAMDRQYDRLFAALPEPAYLVFGNVDVPEVGRRHLRAGHHLVDGTTVDIGGARFGFVGGGLPSVYRTPNERPEEEYAAAVAGLGAVDVLCSHIPPEIPVLLYDVVARRLERGSRALLGAISAIAPRYALFGHVHQPLAARTRVGRTECVNVGHFRATGKPYVLAL